MRWVLTVAHRYYQVIMMVDIFQYNNMYTVKPAIQRITRDQNIVEECGPYVTRDGESVIARESHRNH